MIFIDGYDLCSGSLPYGYVLQLNVSFKMGTFSDTQHTSGHFHIVQSRPTIYIATIEYDNHIHGLFQWSIQ